MAGLKHEYLVGLAVDPADSQTIIVSASGSPWQAHSRDDANSLVYRRSVNNREEWKAISKGLPEPRGTIISILAANPNAAGMFYAVNNHGIFLSTDSGISWNSADIDWPQSYISQHPFAIAVADEKE